jgi:hypothetical protein
MIWLDAEDLAEQGMLSAYSEVLPKLKSYVPDPAVLEEVVDSDLPSYSVRAGSVQHTIYSPAVAGSEDESWARATYYFFLVVNGQLEGLPVKFYAINAGNDLGGMFLSETQFQTARRELPKKSDWPYIPTLEAPWYGQAH